MKHLDDEQLAAVALGDDIGDDIHRHIRDCDECRANVEEMAAVLSLIRASGTDELLSPPDHIWDSVVATLDEDQAFDDAKRSTDRESVRGPARVASPRSQSGRTSEADSRAVPRSSPRWRQRFAVGSLAAAFAVGVMAGVGGTRVFDANEDRRPEIVLRATLDTLDSNQALGTAELVRDNGAVALTLDVDPQAAGDGYLEVWLINRDLKRMVSVGVLPDGSRTGTYRVSEQLIGHGYVIVDISREAFDAQPQHSGDSVVRGTLA